MAGKRQPVRVDPELLRQLDEAGPDDRPVQAVVYLRTVGSRAPETVTDEASKVLEGAKATAGTEPSRVNVMRYLGTVTVEAPASFVRALIEQSGVASALANVHPVDDAGIGVPRDPSPSHAAAADAADEGAADTYTSEVERPG
jgi:hypothetical protein